MINKINDESILFLDIETVPQSPDYANVSEKFKILWNKKSERLKNNKDETSESLYPRAGIYAEFGKIVCISVGYFNNHALRIKSFCGDNEKEILDDFADLLNNYFSHSDNILCAHNGKEFDFPYIARRMVINKIPLPKLLNIAGKKPWEIKHLDTMELWKFGDYKNYTSLELLAAVFDIPTPKDDINGSDVWKVYWQNNDLDRIKTYCEKDVVTIVQLYRCYKLQNQLNETDIIFT